MASAVAAPSGVSSASSGRVMSTMGNRAACRSITADRPSGANVPIILITSLPFIKKSLTCLAPHVENAPGSPARFPN